MSVTNAKVETATAADQQVTAPVPDTHPKAFWFIFWGEFAERSSYYGMRAILILYMTQRLHLKDDQAAEWYSYFKTACYLLPLLGGFLADRYFGKYWTIVGFSVPYVLGQFLIGIESQAMLVLALALAACGSGVIKPNISALMGLTYDQQRPGSERLRAAAFLWFYMSINIGSTISLLALPMIRNKFGYQVAFLVPAIFMTGALAAFAAGKRFYAVERVGPRPPATPEERRRKWQVLASLFGVFGLIVFFWVVYEHNDTQWVYFARDFMKLRLPDWLGGARLQADQFQFINAVLVVTMIPFSQWFWPRVDPTGRRFPQTTKILLGFLFTAAAPVAMALAAAPAVTIAAQNAADAMASGAMTAIGAAQNSVAAIVSGTATTFSAAGFSAAGEANRVSMVWIFLAYFLLTAGEVLVYGTGLDLSYAYAPADMKGFVTACFLVTNAIGNFINSQVFAKLYGTQLTPATFFIVDAVLVLAAAIAFYFVGRRFQAANQGSAAAP